MIKKLDEKFEEVILVVLLILMTVILGVQIIARYVFGNSLSWSEELVRYLFIWSAFLGVPYCIKKEASLKVEQFFNMFPKAVREKILMFDKVIMILLFIVLTIFAFTVVKTSFINGQKSPALRLPMWTVQSSVMVGSLLSLVRLAQKLVYNIKNKESRSKADF